MLILEELKKFIENEGWERKENIYRNTKLEEDLNITGADAVEFLISFAVEFNVEISTFNADDYFSPEGLFNLDFLVFSPKINKKTLTVGDLEKAIRNKKLE